MSLEAFLTLDLALLLVLFFDRLRILELGLARLALPVLERPLAPLLTRQPSLERLPS